MFNVIYVIYYYIAVGRLVSYLPEAEQSDGVGALRSTLHSPQLQQAMDALAEALNSDNFNSILSSFNIDPAPGMAKLVSCTVYI